MSIRIGLIGAGQAGQAHLESVTSFPDVQVAAVCDSDRARAEAVARPFSAGVHINFRTLLESERLDAVFICLPPFARGEPESAAARAGIHLLLERPVALNVEKARQIQREIEKAGVVSAVACPWRYLSGTEQARDLLREKKIALVRGWRTGGVPREGWRRRFESSGGQMALDALDLLDLARHLGGEMATVTAVKFQGIAAARVPDYDIEDAVSALIRFRSGAVGEITSTDLAPREETVLSVLADNLELRLTPQSLEILAPDRRTQIDHVEPGLRACHRAFLEAVKSGKPGPVRSPYSEAVRILEVALAANESAQIGKVVNL